MKIYGLVLIYNCEEILQRFIDKLPFEDFDKVIFSDDGSNDQTLEILKKNDVKFIQNKHLGYGGNLLNGLKKCFEDGADYVVELHGDGQYLGNDINLVKKIFDKNNDLILGDRFFNLVETTRSGMPAHIFIGNLFLSFLARIGLGFHLNDFFPGFRCYSKKFCDVISQYSLSNGYQFSFEIIAISKLNNLKITSMPIICNYKEEKKTAPLWYIFPCIFNLILRSIQFRLAKKKLNLSVFKKIEKK